MRKINNVLERVIYLSKGGRRRSNQQFPFPRSGAPLQMKNQVPPARLERATG